MEFIEEPGIDFSELDDANCQIEELKAAIADAKAGNVTDEQHQQAIEFIADKQRYITTVERTIQAVNCSIASLTHERVQLKKQVFMQHREITQLKAAKELQNV
jgi:predicted RNase H-like nuclease (RuvC/YqgF family)